MATEVDSTEIFLNGTCDDLGSICPKIHILLEHGELRLILPAWPSDFINLEPSNISEPLGIEFQS